ncbi:MAG: thioredoxin family protein [Lentisphaeria bacterium]|nr:thioredoxin family protein [Lentisphaeria bacterium]
MNAKSLWKVLVGAIALCLAAPVRGEGAQEMSPEPPAQSSEGGDLWFQDVFPSKLTNAAGWEIDAASALRGKTVGVYFSAIWCGPCRQFTPRLIEFYKQVAGKGDFEIVFVSSDRSQEDMMKYMKQDGMPFTAVPFDADFGKALRDRLKVNGIPRLVIYDRTGKILSDNGRWDVVMLGADALKAWRSPDYKPKTYKDYREAGARTASAPAAQGGKGVSGWLAGPTPQWHIRMDTALRAAQRENKKIFILSTGSDWCGWCKKLYGDLLAKPEFTDFARENLILVYLDFPMRKPMPEYQKLYNKEVARAMRISGGYPSAFIFDGEGRRLGAVSGYKAPEKYMQILRNIVSGRASKLRPGSRTMPPPPWLRQSPEELTPMLERKKQNAARADEAAKKAKKEASFEILAWGLGKDKVDRPFDPGQEIRLPVKKEVFFKVRYRVPETPKSLILMRTTSAAGNSPFVSGSGEHVFRLRNWRAGSQNKIYFLLRLQMEESGFFTAAEVPCRITWE